MSTNTDLLYSPTVKPALMAVLGAIPGLVSQGSRPTQVKVSTPTIYTSYAGFRDRESEGDLTRMTYLSVHRLYIPSSDPVRAEAELEQFANAIPAAFDADPTIGLGGVIASVSQGSVIDVATDSTAGGRTYIVYALISEVFCTAPFGQGLL